jgi:phage gp16-like protein
MKSTHTYCSCGAIDKYLIDALDIAINTVFVYDDLCLASGNLTRRFLGTLQNHTLVDKCPSLLAVDDAEKSIAEYLRTWLATTARRRLVAIGEVQESEDGGEDEDERDGMEVPIIYMESC